MYNKYYITATNTSAVMQSIYSVGQNNRSSHLKKAPCTQLSQDTNSSH